MIAGWFRTTRGSLLAVALIGLGVLFPLWTSRGIVYSNHSDIIALRVGTQLIGREAVRGEGRLPLWDPSMNGGAPGFANPEAMYLFPLNALFLALPMAQAVNGVILLNFIGAGAAMLLFCRRHLHPGSALAAAAAYMLAHRYLATIYAGWLSKMSMYALTPLLFWSCDRLIDRPTRGRVAGFAVVGALTLFQGDMQQLYFSGIGCVLYIFVRLTVEKRTAGRRMIPALGCLALGAALTVMLAAPALLPRLEFAALSTRTQPNLAFLLKDSPVPAELPSFFNPRDQGPDGTVRSEFWENSFYFGIWLVPLWLAALVGKRRRVAAALFAALVLMVFLCFDTPVLRAIYEHFPGFSLFRQSSRILFLAQFVAVFLGGLGVDALLPLLPRAARLALVGLLLLAPILDRALRDSLPLATRPLTQALPRYPFHDLLDRRQNGGRVAAIERVILPYGTAAYYGIDLINGYSPLQLRDYIDYFSILQDGTPRAIPKGPVTWTDLHSIAKPEMLRALDVRYLVGDPSLPLDGMGYERVWESPAVPLFVYYHGVLPVPVAIWRVPHPLGPAYFATSLHAVGNREQSLAALAAAASPLDAYVFGLDPAAPAPGFSGGTADFSHRGINRYDYRISSRGRNFLIISQVWYPGWAAELDGKPVPLYRTNHALLGCFVPAGDHRLSLEMTCPLFWAGLAAAGVAGLMILAFSFAFRRPAR